MLAAKACGVAFGRQAKEIGPASRNWPRNSSGTGNRSPPSPGPSTFTRQQFTASSRGRKPYAAFLFFSAAQAKSRPFGFRDRT